MTAPKVPSRQELETLAHDALAHLDGEALYVLEQSRRALWLAGWQAGVEAAKVELQEPLELCIKYLGCGDNSCLFVRSKGMSTNGGCRCCGHGGHRPFVPAALARLFKAVQALAEKEGGK